MHMYLPKQRIIAPLLIREVVSPEPPRPRRHCQGAPDTLMPVW